jgi:hypothetical protein
LYISGFSIYDYELANCVTLNGFTRVSYTGTKDPEMSIYINPYTVQHVHSKMRNIVSPTPMMVEMIEKYKGLLEGVTLGISIRRGSYCEDSRQYKGSQADTPAHYFCSDSGFEKFKLLIKQEPGKVFVSSDSISSLGILHKEFGDKISFIDIPFTTMAGRDQGTEQTIENLHKVFLKWFLLSMCPKVAITTGNGDMVGFSTYGYTAAIYGNKPIISVTN